MAHPADALAQLTVPFRMQPGLRRLEAGARHLTPLQPGSPLWLEKKQVLAAGASRLAVPGFDADPVVDAIRARARAEGVAADGPLELAFEQDFALLDGAGGTLPWLCVCVPSHWAPEDKLGLRAQSAAAIEAAHQALLLFYRKHLVRDCGTHGLLGGIPERRRDAWLVQPEEAHHAGLCALLHLL